MEINYTEIISKNNTNQKLIQYRKSYPVGIEIRGLYKSFKENEVLKGIDLEVMPQETLVILGRSGAGKTLLLRHIISLETADSGEILFNGINIKDPEIRSKFRFAMVFQSTALFNSLSVSENIALYLREHRIFAEEEKISQIVKSTLSLVGLEGKENEMPSVLSGGMKRRVATARALAMNPDMLLFDEPTTGLDPMMTRTVGDLILDLKNKVELTQIIVTHDIDLAFYTADRIAILSNGKIIEVGNATKIKNSTNKTVVDFITPQF